MIMGRRAAFDPRCRFPTGGTEHDSGDIVSIV